MRIECEHGSLKRSCQICHLQEELREAQEEISKLREANTVMLEDLKRISKIVIDHEEAKYQPVGTVRLIGSIANGIIADIEKGAERPECKCDGSGGYNERFGQLGEETFPCPVCSAAFFKRKESES